MQNCQQLCLEGIFVLKIISYTQVAVMVGTFVVKDQGVL